MSYREQAMDFLKRSREELDRLEAKRRVVSEIVAKLEGLLAEGKEEASGKVLPSRQCPSPSPPLFPNFSPFLEESEDLGARTPIGEVAEFLLKERQGPMSLEELYQAIKNRTDILPSSDLKNAIRVALIRRRPRVVSERRGWFRYIDIAP